jgi:hypothetical protein
VPLLALVRETLDVLGSGFWGQGDALLGADLGGVRRQGVGDRDPRPAPLEGPSDFGFNPQRTTGFGFEARQRTLRWPWSSGPSLDKMACFQRSASLALKVSSSIPPSRKSLVAVMRTSRMPGQYQAPSTSTMPS